MAAVNSPSALDRRRALCAADGVFLDGKPAKISGARCEYALIWSLVDSQSCFFAWRTVAVVMGREGESRGQFRSV